MSQLSFHESIRWRRGNGPPAPPAFLESLCPLIINTLSSNPLLVARYASPAVLYSSISAVSVTTASSCHSWAMMTWCHHSNHPHSPHSNSMNPPPPQPPRSTLVLLLLQLHFLSTKKTQYIFLYITHLHKPHLLLGQQRLQIWTAFHFLPKVGRRCKCG